MAIYFVLGSCFENGGEIERDATTIQNAQNQYSKMKKNILHDLKVSTKSSAIVEMFQVVKGGKQKRLKRERITH